MSRQTRRSPVHNRHKENTQPEAGRVGRNKVPILRAAKPYRQLRSATRLTINGDFVAFNQATTQL
ncbi:hypothetical protein PS854_01196 [Pseudomonas fluorescens]|jgi:hypothetical protein|uniref:Uncharacterized protein n=1 Tax=Pseudomonas fluorescens TaxID=294 RepID=A0A5E7HXF9_PSEFL|nr:hypothetical protein PS854_01196 [Pseudomonas fluorescens]